jgi:hypothetical protein
MNTSVAASAALLLFAMYPAPHIPLRPIGLTLHAGLPTFCERM